MIAVPKTDSNNTILHKLQNIFTMIFKDFTLIHVYYMPYRFWCRYVSIWTRFKSLLINLKTPYLRSCSRKEIPTVTTLEYTHDAVNKCRIEDTDSEVEYRSGKSVDTRDSAIFMHLNTTSILFVSRASSIICATSIAWKPNVIHGRRNGRPLTSLHLNMYLFIRKQIPAIWENWFWYYAVVSWILNFSHIHK